METEYFIDKFQKSVGLLDKAAFSNKQLELKVVIYGDSVVLKIQKKTWLNEKPIKPFRESVFFSVWINDDFLNDGKLYYNIHALKMRELTGYKIKSRDFAEVFRKRFKRYADDWPNVSTSFGPLTLMQGWVNLNIDNIEDVIASLANRFLKIQHIVDELLADRKK